MASRGVPLFPLVLLVPSLALAYTWPNDRLDQLEALRWDQDGHNSNTVLIPNLTPCETFILGKEHGRTNAADWIRAAYHDMATHNVEDGTGGMDGSIRFQQEQDRGENLGDGFRNTMAVLGILANAQVSVADVLAIGMILAVEHCGGPEIDFRGGRVDAPEPGAPGVPEPQQDLDSHISSFARQGFNQTEMIGLVACGHSFGGVQHEIFPEAVPDIATPDNSEGNAPFDSTPAHFDNKIATEFIDGTTQNPLVVGFNATMNSDGRIFGSDGNVTMKAFAKSQSLFAKTCGSLFARMLDTVPRNVKLTEVIKPLPVKPHDMVLTYVGNNTLQLTGQFRFWNTAENPKRKVTLTWTDSNGKPCPNNTVVLEHTPDMIGSAMSGRYSSLWYKLPNSVLTLDATRSISRMSFKIDEGNGILPRLENQGGKGFVMQDIVMWTDSSCRESGATPGRFDIAVRDAATPLHSRQGDVRFS